jgi:hypothetical protein
MVVRGLLPLERLATYLSRQKKKLSGTRRKRRGQSGRGTIDHIWRVFENEREYLFKHLDIQVLVKSEKENNSEDYNIICFGVLNIDRDTSTAVIKKN